MLPWKWAAERLPGARNYWIATARPNGRPHSRPVWDVFLDGTFYFSTGSLAAPNLAVNPQITLHLKSGSEVVIIEGTVETVADSGLIRRIIVAYNEKYNCDLDPSEPGGPLLAVVPLVAFGWVSDASGLDKGAAFHGTATRWRVFLSEPDNVDLAMPFECHEGWPSPAPSAAPPDGHRRRGST